MRGMGRRLKKVEKMYILQEYLEGRGHARKIAEKLGVPEWKVTKCACYNGVQRKYRKHE